MYMLPPALVEAVSQRVVEPINMLMIDWPSGPVYMHSGIGEILYDSQVWVGVGNLGALSAVRNDSNLGAATMTATLSGIDNDTITALVSEDVVNRVVDRYLGFIGEDGRLIDAVKVFSGRIRVPGFGDRHGDEPTITLEVVSKLVDWSKSRPDRYTDESHRRNYPNDMFYQYVAQMAERSLHWPSDKKSDVPLKTNTGTY